MYFLPFRCIQKGLEGMPIHVFSNHRFLFKISFLIESSGPCMGMISGLISLEEKEAARKTCLHFKGSWYLLIRQGADWQPQSHWSPFSVTLVGGSKSAIQSLLTKALKQVKTVVPCLLLRDGGCILKFEDLSPQKSSLCSNGSRPL